MSATTLLISILTGVIINVSHGQIIENPTTSDSTGEYYVTSQTNKFNQSKIQCSSNIACYIECNADNSCFNLTINCGNSSLCHIQCGYYSCEDLTVYISPDNTTMTCATQGACRGDLTLYTDYDNYPLSTIEMDCFDGTCFGMIFKDVTSGQDSHDQLTAERFKIYCHICKWGSSDYSNLMAIPTIVNETGEYYLDSGSLVDFQCSTDKLCYIDCSNGGCRVALFDCGPSQECYILCGQDAGCGYSAVTAVGQDQFTYLCEENAYDCSDWESFNLTNIDTVNITCQETNGCVGKVYHHLLLYCTLSSIF